jgi:excisionase family DNA binding protein
MSDQESPNDVLTTKEVAEILRCSKDTVAKLAKSQRLKSVSLTTGGKKGLPRFLRKNVMEFLNGECDGESKSESTPKSTAKPTKNLQIKRHSIMGIEP